MQLLGNRVLLEPLAPALRSSGGIVYVQSYRDDQKQYKVLAVGPGRVNKKGILIPPEVQPGDHVLAELYQQHMILPNGNRIADASEVIAKWRPNDSQNLE